MTHNLYDMKELDKNVKRKYFISDYDPKWISQFNDIKKFLQSVFGEKAIQIEHVGSTSIPGMAAKPLIDILVLVNRIEEFEKEKEEMIKAGYEWGENYIAPDTLLFFKTGTDGEKMENIHVCKKGSLKERQFLVMRDFLRTFPNKAKEYSDLKKKLFEQYPNDYPAYRSAKAPFLERVRDDAYAWEENGLTGT